MIDAAEKGPLLPFDDIVVALDQDLVQRLVHLVLPLGRMVAGKYRIRLAAADVKFENGLALVRLDGRASLAQWTERDAVAEVRLYSALARLRHPARPSPEPGGRPQRSAARRAWTAGASGALGASLRNAW